MVTSTQHHQVVGPVGLEPEASPKMHGEHPKTHRPVPTPPKTGLEHPGCRLTGDHLTAGSPFVGPVGLEPKASPKMHSEHPKTHGPVPTPPQTISQIRDNVRQVIISTQDHQVVGPVGLEPTASPQNHAEHPQNHGTVPTPPKTGLERLHQHRGGDHLAAGSPVVGPVGLEPKASPKMHSEHPKTHGPVPTPPQTISQIRDNVRQVIISTQDHQVVGPVGLEPKASPKMHSEHPKTHGPVPTPPQTISQIRDNVRQVIISTQDHQVVGPVGLEPTAKRL